MGSWQECIIRLKNSSNLITHDCDFFKRLQNLGYSVIECLIINSYLFYADFFSLSIFSVGHDYVNFICCSL